MFALPFLPTVEIKTLVIFVLAFFAGLSAGCGSTCSPVQGDIVIYDEMMTGERKRVYFAAFNFVQKVPQG